MPELYPSPASTSDNENSLNEYRPLTLTPADISATMLMSASHIHLPISGGGCKQQSSPFGSDQALQSQAAMGDHYFCHSHPPVLSCQEHHFGCSQPYRSYSSFDSRSHLEHDPGDPSRIVSGYDTPWWMGETAILNKPWQWDQVMTCCIFHYQHWLDGIENDGLTIPEQVDHTSVPSLMGLRWIREHLLTLIEEQREGIRDKMAEIQIYTTMLDRLKRGRGE
ncbi:uncharacterized protein EDB93DRAFT_1250996 [Suillus bovinus]|uniref:uncharacterized protein n=1 Tax=Suillus bovinus TaxID=48563 RepID=UPI001B875369|nr:uncharacterized protein EDB93DRAFT_1250996 [Suillus bovinus]KAG2146459.1 hypothetical protein EDB93DRAFT_1250996 [Suillus bovinus]